MAKNYSLTEATQIIVENEDAAQITELGKRFPLLVSKLTYIAAKAGEELNDLMQFMPENLSANKVNQSIKKALEAADEDEELDEDEEEDVEDTPKKRTAKGGKKSVKVEDDEDDEDAGDSDYDNWNNAKMYKLLGEMGKRKDCKEKFGDLSHDSMLKYLKKYGPGSAADDEDFEEEEQQTESYEGKSAVELYKICKSRKIKAEQKKPAKYYVTLLKKADEEAAKAAKKAEDDEDWDEDEVEDEPAPKKPAKKTTAKSEKKPAKKPAKAEEDDEDWDI